MKLLKHLLVVVIAATGVIGSARAQTQGHTFDLSTITPAGNSFSDSFPSGSFVDTFTFTVDANNHIITGGVTAASNVSGGTLALFNDSNGGHSQVFSGSPAPQTADFAPGNYSGQLSGSVADPKAGSGSFTFSVAANPEPAEWALLLCGLVVAGFIARRKISLVAA